jgi:NAD-dependent SIR2 family protein deacetylase
MLRLLFLSPRQFWDSYYQLFAVTLSEIIPVQTDEAVMTAIDIIQPNEGHKFFARLEEKEKEVTILTQNVDGLHQKAGSNRVLEIHGNVTTCSCLLCGRRYELKDVYEARIVPTCECGIILRPDVVFFGDPVKEYKRAEDIIVKSDLIIVAGTSLQVAPFNHLPNLAAAANIPIVYINGEKPDDLIKFDFILQGNISEICELLEKNLR